MIVCQCRGTTDREIREALVCGARCGEDVGRRCDGAGMACGGCRTTIEVLVRDSARKHARNESLSSVA